MLSENIKGFIELARAFMAQGGARVPSYPTYEARAAVLGPRYREVETPFGTIAYLTPALDLADGGMGAPVEYCDV